jgi:hypothetical protein
MRLRDRCEWRSAVMQTQHVYKYAFAVSVSVGRSVSRMRRHTHTQKSIQLQNTNRLICSIQNLVIKLIAYYMLVLVT